VSITWIAFWGDFFYWAVLVKLAPGEEAKDKGEVRRTSQIEQACFYRAFFPFEEPMSGRPTR
jgi:hypothetical protein